MFMLSSCGKSAFQPGVAADALRAQLNAKPLGYQHIEKRRNDENI